MSTFKDWKKDTHQLLDSCFESDFEKMDIFKFTNDDYEIKRLKVFLRSIYKRIKDAFCNYVSINEKLHLRGVNL
jgi:hypothetical protein